MTLKQAVDVALSMELVETEASKTKGGVCVCVCVCVCVYIYIYILFTQWFRDGKANRDRIVRMPSVKVVKVRSCKQDVSKKAIKYQQKITGSGITGEFTFGMNFKLWSLESEN